MQRGLCPATRKRGGGARACLLAGLIAVLLVPQPALPAPDQHVKAAFVFNFIRFTEWPPARLSARDGQLVLCVWAGDGPLGDAMRALGGRTVDERPLRVQEIDRTDDLVRCHALFVSDGAARASVGNWLRRAEALSVLTVGEVDGFATGGGMIGLVSDGERMRFEINDRAVKRGGLRLGSQLQQLGRAVDEAWR